MTDTIVVTDAGMSIITNRLRQSSDGTPHFVHWGIGAVTAAAGNTALGSAGAHESRTVGTMTQQNTNVPNDTFQVVGLITCLTGAKAVTEAGLFDAAGSGTPVVGGNMFLRGTFSAINVNVADSIEFTIKAAFDQA